MRLCMSDKISIVIPAYNADKYLEECLLSVMNQTVKPDEIIVVDDCSTDSTAHIAEKYAQVFSSCPNHGIGFARGQGSKRARSDFVCFLSADDCYEPFYIETMLRYASPNTILFSDYYVCDENLQPQDVFFAPKFNGQDEFQKLCIQYALEKNMFVNFSSVMIPRSVFEEISFRDDVRYGEDLIFLLETLVHGFKWKHVPLPLLRYRVHSKAGTFHLSFEKWRKIWVEITPLLVKLGVHKETARNSMIRSYRLYFNPLNKLKKKVSHVLSNPFFAVRRNRYLKFAWRRVNASWT